jgi:hypothetical protein
MLLDLQRWRVRGKLYPVQPRNEGLTAIVISTADRWSSRYVYIVRQNSAYKSVPTKKTLPDGGVFLMIENYWFLLYDKKNPATHA